MIIIRVRMNGKDFMYAPLRERTVIQVWLEGPAEACLIQAGNAKWWPIASSPFDAFERKLVGVAK